MRKLALILLAFLFTVELNAYTITGKWDFSSGNCNAVIGGSSFNATATGAVNYDATNGVDNFADGIYISLPAAVGTAINGYSSFSIVLIAKESSIHADYAIESFITNSIPDPGGADGDFTFEHYNTTGAPWCIRMAPNGIGFTQGTDWAATQAEHRINIEYTGTQWKYYKNGNQVGPTSFTAAQTISSGDVLRIGRAKWSGDHLYSGSSVKQVYVVDGVLNGAEPIEGTPTFTHTITPTLTQTLTMTHTTTPTFTKTATQTNTPVIGAWTLMKDHAAFGPRMFPAACVFKNKMWITGGMLTEAGPYLNDAWWSTNGVDWYAATRNAEWPGRMRHSLYVKDNKMWVVSGQTAELNSNDVWNSSDGIVWTQVKDHAAFLARRAQMMGNIVDSSGNMWILTGQDATNLMEDAWYSNNGVDWTAATRAAESSWRSGGAGAWFNNKLIIVGGNGGSATSNYHCWVSTNGVVWTESGLVFDKQIQHNILTEANNILFSLTGSTQGGAGPAWDRVDYTYDGDTWYVGPNGFGVRDAVGSVFYKGRLWVMAGMDKDTNSFATILDDVWSSKRSDYTGPSLNNESTYDGF